jgi:hypothetical protein
MLIINTISNFIWSLFHEPNIQKIIIERGKSWLEEINPNIHRSREDRQIRLRKDRKKEG